MADRHISLLDPDDMPSEEPHPIRAEAKKLYQRGLLDFIREETYQESTDHASVLSRYREDLFNFFDVPLSVEYVSTLPPLPRQLNCPAHLVWYHCLFGCLSLCHHLPSFPGFGGAVEGRWSVRPLPPFRPRLMSSRGLSKVGIYDGLRVGNIAIVLAVLYFIDISYIYHFIRQQSTIKLYVLFNVMEILDKLLASFGQDIYDTLFCYMYTHTRLSRSLFSPHRYGLKTCYVVALCYSLIHTLILLLKMVTLNVSVNSHSNALFTLLISNNFVELKSSVFKTYKEENVFQIMCAGR